MQLPDTNILVYAFRDDRPEHQAAHDWLSGVLDGPAPVALTSAALSGFVRIVTHPSIFSPPSRIDRALDFVDALLEADVTLPVEPGTSYPRMFTDLCLVTHAAGNAVPDVHIAALAIESGAELASHDRGFARFPGLRWVDPIAEATGPARRRRS